MIETLNIGTQLLPAEAGRLMSRLEVGVHSKEMLLILSLLCASE